MILKNYPKKYMSLREWKKLAESKTKAGKMKNQLCNQITAGKIKSKTSDAAITKSFRLDEIIEGLKGKPAAPIKDLKEGKCLPPIKIKALNTETGESFDFESITKAAKDLIIDKTSIRRVLNGTHKTSTSKKYNKRFRFEKI